MLFPTCGSLLTLTDLNFEYTSPYPTKLWSYYTQCWWVLCNSWCALAELSYFGGLSGDAPSLGHGNDFHSTLILSGPPCCSLLQNHHILYYKDSLDSGHQAATSIILHAPLCHTPWGIQGILNALQSILRLKEMVQLSRWLTTSCQVSLSILLLPLLVGIRLF